jgi:hypothetical protein
MCHRGNSNPAFLASFSNGPLHQVGEGDEFHRNLERDPFGGAKFGNRAGSPILVAESSKPSRVPMINS